jgi:hypothetical protein
MLDVFFSFFLCIECVIVLRVVDDQPEDNNDQVFDTTEQFVEEGKCS